MDLRCLARVVLPLQEGPPMATIFTLLEEEDMSVVIPSEARLVGQK